MSKRTHVPRRAIAIFAIFRKLMNKLAGIAILIFGKQREWLTSEWYRDQCVTLVWEKSLYIARPALCTSHCNCAIATTSAIVILVLCSSWYWHRNTGWHCLHPTFPKIAEELTCFQECDITILWSSCTRTSMCDTTKHHSLICCTSWIRCLPLSVPSKALLGCVRDAMREL